DAARGAAQRRRALEASRRPRRGRHVRGVRLATRWCPVRRLRDSHPVPSARAALSVLDGNVDARADAVATPPERGDADVADRLVARERLRTTFTVRLSLISSILPSRASQPMPM